MSTAHQKNNEHTDPWTINFRGSKRNQVTGKFNHRLRVFLHSVENLDCFSDEMSFILQHQLVRGHMWSPIKHILGSYGD